LMDLPPELTLVVSRTTELSGEDIPAAAGSVTSAKFVLQSVTVVKDLQAA
jgi:hypothetical protein